MQMLCSPRRSCLVAIRVTRMLPHRDMQPSRPDRTGFAQTRVSDVADRCVSPPASSTTTSTRASSSRSRQSPTRTRFFLRLTRRLREQQTARQQLEWLIAFALPGAPDEPEAEGDSDLWLVVWVY